MSKKSIKKVVDEVYAPSTPTQNNTLPVLKSDVEVLGHSFTIYGTSEEPLFKAKDVAEWLDHSNQRMMIKFLDPDEKQVNIVCTSTGAKESWMITEDGLYELLMHSRKPIAKPFQKAVKGILKEIRLKGGYMVARPDETPEQIMARALLLADDTIKRQQAMIKEYKPKAEYYDEVMSSDHGCSATEVGSALGISAQAVNNFLAQRGYIYKRGNRWYCRTKYAGSRVFKDYTWINPTSDGYFVGSSLGFTEYGKQQIIRLFQNKVSSLDPEIEFE